VNFKNTLIFSLAVACFVIGLHQSITVGFQYSYWLFMFTFGLLFWYKLRKDKALHSDDSKRADKKLEK